MPSDVKGIMDQISVRLSMRLTETDASGDKLEEAGRILPLLSYLYSLLLLPWIQKGRW